MSVRYVYQTLILEFIDLNCHLLKIVSLYRDPQFHVGEKLLIFFLIWDQIFANLDVLTRIMFQITVI